jgi:dTDP-4-dehydrorhamnose reductase
MRAGQIAVIGATGQVARALQRAAKASGVALVAAGRPQADIGDSGSLERFFAAVRPSLVINAAAYTGVDKAESECAAAHTINCAGPAALAALCGSAGVPLIHISTDYVFDGTKRAPYVEDDACAPLSVYGRAKAEGEVAIRAACRRHVIVRTAWVYGPDGQNFLKTMLRLGAERDALRVVADQHGTPTSADHLAVALLDIAAAVTVAGEAATWGTYHLTAAGETTWHGFATEIFRLERDAGRRVPRLEAITTQEYPTPAVRPQYSVLDTRKIANTFGIALPPWQAGVADCIKRLSALELESGR